MFRRPKTTQREYLYEDIEQIKRYFPGAEYAETLMTPFDLTNPSASDLSLPATGHLPSGSTLVAGTTRREVAWIL